LEDRPQRTIGTAKKQEEWHRCRWMGRHALSNPTSAARPGSREVPSSYAVAGAHAVSARNWARPTAHSSFLGGYLKKFRDGNDVTVLDKHCRGRRARI